MLRREFLQLLGIRPIIAAAADTTAIQVNDVTVNARAFGAIGDGVHDDTAAIQAAIDYSLENGKPCFIPSGRYRISSPLVIGSADGRKLQQGFMLIGSGRSVSARGGVGGTLIEMSGSGHSAIIKIEKSAWRGVSISDLGLECRLALGAEYGLLFNSTEFSGHAVRNVAVTTVRVAFGILQGTGVNGEFTLFDNCFAAHVDVFFYSNAGQAYVQHFTHCGCVLNAGGIYFHLDLSSGGGGLNVSDFNATGKRHKDGGVSDTTLVKNGHSSSCLNFLGGRIENLTQLYQSNAGTTALHVTGQFNGLQLTLDTSGSVKSFIDIAYRPDILTIASCSFQGISGKETLEVRTKESWAYILFKECFFDFLSRPPSVISDIGDIGNQVCFENCKAVATIDQPRHRRPFPFDKSYQNEIGALGRRKAFSENGWVHSGRPTNLLSRPHFTDRNGKNISADAPWAHFGATQSFSALDWNHALRRSRSSSPWAKIIELPPKSGIFQDIKKIDLASNNTNYHLSGADFHVVVYQAMISQVAGNTNLRFVLTDSSDGRVFDVFELTDNRGVSKSTRLVTLVAYVARKLTSSYVRFSLENTGAISATIEFSWQLVAHDQNPAFVGDTPAEFETEWGVSAESGRFWHRLALPYKKDEFGSDAIRQLDGLFSDVYLSQSTERVHTFANGRWWSEPRMSATPTEPSVGYWAHGDIAMNSAPDPGAPLGWIQVTPGKFVAKTPWTPNTMYQSSSRVYNDYSVYDCVLAGTSAFSSGPTGSEADIKDGTCTWNYVGTLSPVACARAWAPGVFKLADRVSHLKKVYECSAPGRSEASPVDVATRAGDGSAHWQCIGPLAIFKAIGYIEK